MLRTINTTEDALEFLRWASERKVIACDTETTGVDVRAPGFAVRLIQFGDARSAWVVPFRQWWGVVNEFFARFDGTLLFHNARFDLAALIVEGIRVPWHQVIDTMIAVRLAESNRPAGLKEAASRHVAGSAATAQRDLAEAMVANKWGWDTIPLNYPAYVKYAAMDTILTYRLWEHPVIKKGLASPVFQMESEVLSICSTMSDNGMRIDLDYCRTQAAELRSITGAIREQMTDVYGLSIGSNQALGSWILGHGGRITHMTQGGAPSVAKDQLLELIIDPASNDHVRYVAEQTLRYRKADKIAGTYLEPFVYKADGNQMLHASIETLAAKTGRMSIRDPALQTLPKPNDDPASRTVRKSVIPWTEDHVLVSADWEQVELRIAAHLSNDERLIEAFAIADADPDGDLFAEIGKVVYRDPGFKKTDPRRKVTKNTTYGMLYGAGPEKIASTAGIPYEQARDARTAILATFPGLSVAMKRYEREVKEFGSITTLMGRELQVDPDKAYKGLNAMIQGTAADFLKRATVLLAHAGFDESMIVPVHDEVLFSVHRSDLDEARHEIRKAMLISDLTVSVPAEPSAGEARWADDA